MILHRSEHVGQHYCEYNKGGETREEGVDIRDGKDIIDAWSEQYS